MYIQQKLVVTSILTLCMLTVSFLLSSLTVLQNGKSSQLAASALTQNNASALLIESVPESCENNRSPESETCLRLNTTLNSDLVTSLLLEDTTKESQLLACEIVVGQWLGEKASHSEVVLVSKTSVDEITPDDGNMYKSNISSSEAMEDSPTGLNGVCVELYRDNGDGITNPNEDQLIGFSVMMDDSTSNQDHYQFTNLPQGTYFAKFYAIRDSSIASRIVELSVEPNMIAESESNTFIQANAID